MPTTAEFLNELVTQKTNLANALSGLGITASTSEKYNTLIDKVEAIPLKTATNLTVSGSTITAAAGYYNSAVSKNVSAGSIDTRSFTVNASLSNPTITATGSNVCDAVYVSTTLTSSYNQSITPGWISDSSVTISATTNVYVPISGASYETVTSDPGTRTIVTISPSTSTQYVKISKGYTQSTNVKINAMSLASNTLGTTASGDTWRTITPSTSTQYINVTEGYTPAGNFKISAMSEMTLPTAAVSAGTFALQYGTSITKVADLVNEPYLPTSLNVNNMNIKSKCLLIPKGYHSTAEFYNIPNVELDSIRVSAPTNCTITLTNVDKPYGRVVVRGNVQGKATYNYTAIVSGSNLTASVSYRYHILSQNSGLTNKAGAALYVLASMPFPAYGENGELLEENKPISVGSIYERFTTTSTSTTYTASTNPIFANRVGNTTYFLAATSTIYLNSSSSSYKKVALFTYPLYVFRPASQSGSVALTAAPVTTSTSGYHYKVSYAGYTSAQCDMTINFKYPYDEYASSSSKGLCKIAGIIGYSLSDTAMVWSTITHSMTVTEGSSADQLATNVEYGYDL